MGRIVGDLAPHIYGNYLLLLACFDCLLAPHPLQTGLVSKPFELLIETRSVLQYLPASPLSLSVVCHRSEPEGPAASDDLKGQPLRGGVFLQSRSTPPCSQIAVALKNSHSLDKISFPVEK